MSHQQQQLLPVAVSRKLLRSVVGASANKSVYRWLNVRRLDRSRLLVFTMCLSFAVYIVFSSIAWLAGESGGLDAIRVVIVRQPYDEMEAAQGMYECL